MSKFFVSQRGKVAVRLDRISCVQLDESSETPMAEVWFIDEEDCIELTDLHDIADLMKELRNGT